MRGLRTFGLIALGLVTVSGGLVLMFLGGYMANGEAHHNLREGMPAFAFGAVSTLGGLAAIARGAFNLRRK